MHLFRNSFDLRSFRFKRRHYLSPAAAVFVREIVKLIESVLLHGVLDQEQYDRVAQTKIVVPGISLGNYSTLREDFEHLVEQRPMI